MLESWKNKGRTVCKNRTENLAVVRFGSIAARVRCSLRCSLSIARKAEDGEGGARTKVRKWELYFDRIERRMARSSFERATNV